MIKKEFIILLLLLILVSIEVSSDGREISLSKESSHHRKYIEIVQNGKGRIYSEISFPVAVERGESVEFLDDGRFIKKSMAGDKLILLGLPIDLNRASIDDLVAIPGVGIETAKSILEFRGKRGGFRTLNELLKVRGIGQKRLSKIKRYLKV